MLSNLSDSICNKEQQFSEKNERGNWCVVVDKENACFIGDTFLDNGQLWQMNVLNLRKYLNFLK